MAIRMDVVSDNNFRVGPPRKLKARDNTRSHSDSPRLSPHTGRGTGTHRRNPRRNPNRHDNTHQQPAKKHDEQILFYDRNQPYYEFTNFSPHPIEYNGLMYPTAEHLFQAHKFLDHHPDLAERIRNLPTPRGALKEATSLSEYSRDDWFEVNVSVMDKVLKLKLEQHPKVRQKLSRTGKKKLIENSPDDWFWGIGADGKGRNELGKALMRLRARL